MKMLNMNNIYHKAALSCAHVYTNNIELDFSTNYFYEVYEVNNQLRQKISIAGTQTNDFKDWLKNFNLFSWKKIKLSAYLAAGRIHNDLIKHSRINPDLPLDITGHSLGGGVAIAYNLRFQCDKCIAFAPARVIRYSHYYANNLLPNTTLFVDPDDYVSQVLAGISFCLPKAIKYKLPENHIGYSIDDHPIENFINYTNKLIKKGNN